jgi:hypothetical protein
MRISVTSPSIFVPETLDAEDDAELAFALGPVEIGDRLHMDELIRMQFEIDQMAVDGVEQRAEIVDAGGYASQTHRDVHRGQTRADGSVEV